MRHAHELTSAIRHAAEQAVSRHTHTRIGLRTSYDPVNHAIKAELQPEGTETGWMPINPLWQGNGWGFFAPPPAGAQCVIAFQEGHVDCPIYMGALPSDQDRPLPVPDGEIWLQHASGAGFRLTNEGGASYLGSQGQTLTLAADGSVTMANGQGAVVRLVGSQAYLGGDPAAGGTFAPVQTTEGPSSRVLAAL